MASNGERSVGVARCALARRAVAELGPHPSLRAGLDLLRPDDRPRWLALARLLSERVAEDTALAAFARLEADAGSAPDGLATAGPARVAAALAAGGLARAEAVAPVLCRAAAALCDDYRGDLDALAAHCSGLDELGGRIAALAPGLGAATVLRFLRPLRGAWSAARETPLAEPAALYAACARDVPELSPIDVEAALERLGAAACRRQVSRSEAKPSEDQRGGAARCPLGAECPVR